MNGFNVLSKANEAAFFAHSRGWLMKKQDGMLFISDLLEAEA
jgi:hypothetical protein